MQIGQAKPAPTAAAVPVGMKSKGKTQISSSTTNVTFSANTASVRSTLYKYTIPARLAYKILDGTPMRMKLQDASAAELPNTAKVFISYQTPGLDDILVADTLDYRVFAALSVAQQNDERTAETRKIRTKYVGKPVMAVGLKEDTILLVEVNSSAVAATANSWFELDVEEFERL